MRLDRLVLLCPGSRDRPRGVNWEAQVETKLFLESAANLQSLELEFGEGVCPPEYCGAGILLWLLSRSKTTFLHLQTLKLGAVFPPKHLIKFLSQHKSTLRSVELQDCISYNWRELRAFVEQELKLD
jgi:hypothetical protein